MLIEIALEERPRGLIEALKKKLCELGWAVDKSLRLLSIVFPKGSNIGRFGSRYFTIFHLCKLPFARAL